MTILRYIEYYVARLLSGIRGHDAKLFTRADLFKSIPPTVTVTSSEIGASGAILAKEHSQFGSSQFPELSWSLDNPKVKEWILICEDPDAPLPFVPVHGLYHAIPASTTHVGVEDLKMASSSAGGDGKASSGKSAGEPMMLTGGFRLGKNFRGTVYSGPRPPLGHGPHRYFFQVVALTECLSVSNPRPTRDDLLRNMAGKVAGWGEWIGVYENTWQD